MCTRRSFSSEMVRRNSSSSEYTLSKRSQTHRVTRQHGAQTIALVRHTNEDLTSSPSHARECLRASIRPRCRWWRREDVRCFRASLVVSRSQSRSSHLITDSLALVALSCAGGGPPALYNAAGLLAGAFNTFDRDWLFFRVGSLPAAPDDVSVIALACCLPSRPFPTPVPSSGGGDPYGFLPTEIHSERLPRWWSCRGPGLRPGDRLPIQTVSEGKSMCEAYDVSTHGLHMVVWRGHHTFRCAAAPSMQC